MGDATVNGDMPHSVTLEHIASYPIVADLIDYVKKNPYGQKSIDLTNTAYGKFVKPTLPYFETPASYAKPYVVKIDEFGNVALTKVDEKIPILKSESKDVKDTIIAYIHYPLEKASETKSKLMESYSQEYKKCGGDGVVAGGKAVITLSLNLTTEGLNWISTYLASKKEEAKEAAKEVKAEAEEKASE